MSPSAFQNLVASSEDKDLLFSIDRKIQSFIDEFEERLSVDEQQVSYWKSLLSEFKDEMAEDEFRIAVIGSVKAGKSTFVNYLLGRDLLKRGAGIITSIVTRVMSGERLSADLSLKGVEQINAEINAALLFFYEFAQSLEQAEFDVRNSNQRQKIYDFLQKLEAEGDTSQEASVKNRLLLSAYLDGYAEIAPYLDAKEASVILNEDEVVKHQDFVSEERLAVYLNHISLTVPDANLPHGVEIGDCQGIDSPNPNHMTAVLDYLLQSHLAVYLISVRTGIREADVKLINALKRLRLEDRVLFVLNMDLGELDSLEQARQAREKTLEDLQGLGIKNPALYAFSSLYSLLKDLQKTSPDSLDERSSLRLQLWESGNGLVDNAEQERARFEDSLAQIMRDQRYALKMDRGLDLLGRCAKSINDYIAIRLLAHTKHGDGFDNATQDLQARQNELRNTLELLQNSLKTVADKLKGNLKRDVDQFFDRSGPLVGDVLDFIDRFQGSRSNGASDDGAAEVMNRVVGFYQELTDRLNRHINEETNLSIIEYTRQKDDEIKKEYQEQTQAYIAIMDRLFDAYMQEIDSALEGAPSSAPGRHFSAEVAVDVKVPLFSATINYQYATRAQVMFVIGLSKTISGVMNLARRVLKKEESAGGSNKSYLKAVELVKKNATQTILDAVKDYKENLKYGYALTLVDLYGAKLYEQTRSYVEGALVDFGDVLTRVNDERQKSLDIKDTLQQYKSAVRTIWESVSSLRGAKNGAI